jgi:hypothetical protein
MAIETQKYIRKPLIVESVRLTNANFDAVVAWCQGEVATAKEGRQAGKKFIKVRVHNPKHPRQTQAFVGDWLLYTEKGYKIYTNKAFNLSFDLMEELAEGSEFPRIDGDTIVLGPQCFVAKDGSVLNWNGINYVPQTDAAVQGSDELAPGVTVSAAVAAVRANEELSDPRLTGDPVEDQIAEATQPVPVEERIEIHTDSAYPETHTIGGIPREEIDLPAPPMVTGDGKHIAVDPGVQIEDSSSSPPPIRNGQRVLTQEEQTQLGPDAVRELITSGEAILEQDAA